MASLICSRHDFGSEQPTGSGAMIPPTLLPSDSLPRSSSDRIDTGTKAFIVMSSMSSPRWIRCLRSARVTTVRITSLTVPPISFLIALMSSRSPRTHVKRRLVPTIRAL